MSTLQFSFHGPFLYRFLPKEVEIYAAGCPGHTAGIFTAKNELSLTGRYRRGNERRYRIAGPVFTPPSPLPSPDFRDSNKTILYAPQGATPAFETAHFCVVVPLPQIVVPTLPNGVEVVKPPASATGKLKSRATGLRFFYDADLTKKLTLAVDGSSAAAWTADFDAPSLGHSFADIEIRYASVVPEQQEHQDAYECFDHVSKLVGMDWWICYDDLAKPYGSQPFGKTGNNCRAPSVVLL